MQTDSHLEIQAAPLPRGINPQADTQNDPAEISVGSRHLSAQTPSTGISFCMEQTPEFSQQPSGSCPPSPNSSLTLCLLAHAAPARQNQPCCNSSIPRGLLLGVFTLTLPSACCAFSQKFIMLCLETISSERPFLPTCLNSIRVRTSLSVPPSQQLAQHVAQRGH